MSNENKQIEGSVSVSNSAKVGGSAIVRGNVTIGHDLKVDGWLDADNIRAGNKGVYNSLADLKFAFPTPLNGWCAGIVNAADLETLDLYVGMAGEWVHLEGAKMKLDGLSAYDVWLSVGNEGTVEDYLASLKGAKGDKGDSAYETWIKQGHEGTEEDFLSGMHRVYLMPAAELEKKKKFEDPTGLYMGYEEE